VVGWAAYLVTVGGFFLRAPKLPGMKSRPEHETSPSASTPVETDVAH
jgi:hypothetical protein